VPTLAKGLAWSRGDVTPLPVCEKLPRRLAFEHPLYCALAVGVIASPSVKAARRW
jgi:hypothetical protein